MQRNLQRPWHGSFTTRYSETVPHPCLCLKHPGLFNNSDVLDISWHKGLHDSNLFIAYSVLCQNGTLDPNKVKGKIVVCLRRVNARVDKGKQALLAGAVGMVLTNDKTNGNEILADPHLLPASHINFTNGVAVFDYINSTNLWDEHKSGALFDRTIQAPGSKLLI